MLRLATDSSSPVAVLDAIIRSVAPSTPVLSGAGGAYMMPQSVAFSQSSIAPACDGAEDSAGAPPAPDARSSWLRTSQSRIPASSSFEKGAPGSTCIPRKVHQ